MTTHEPPQVVPTVTKESNPECKEIYLGTVIFEGALDAEETFEDYSAARRWAEAQAKDIRRDKEARNQQWEVTVTPAFDCGDTIEASQYAGDEPEVIDSNEPGA